MDNIELDVSSHPPEEDPRHMNQNSPAVVLGSGQNYQSPKASSSGNGQVVTDSEHNSQSQDVSSLDKSQLGIDSELQCQCSKVSSVNKCEVDFDGEQEYQSQNVLSVDPPLAKIVVKDEEVNVVLQVGMEFESEDQAYKCYSRYAVLKGFSIRKDFVNKSRINGAVVSRRYTCYRQGHRPARPHANVRRPRQETRTGCLAHMTIARQPNGKFRVTHFETKHNHEFATAHTAHMLPSQKRLTFAQAVEAELTNSSGEDGLPKLGMGFDSEDQAYEFYNSYAGRVGFSVRKDYVNRSKIDGAVASRRFTCFREGFRQRDKRDLNVKRPRKETRIGCLAQLVISRQSDGKYRATHFEEKHNHELVALCRVRMLRSQKRLPGSHVVEGNLSDESKLEQKLASELVCDAGDNGYFCYDPIDYKNKLQSRRMREMTEGEAESMKQYFQVKQSKNPSFLYAMQLDVEDQLTNVFWTDAKMVTDYSDFGDVVCFDTTYRVNKDSRPFAPFLGVNHHKQIIIFGAAILYDETLESFKWLFQTFADAMSGKKPKTILTDEDPIMAEAVNAVFSEARHQICVWHVYQNTLHHLTDLFAGTNSFINDLNSCFFDHAEEKDFIDAWNVMLDTYGLWENAWLHGIFKDREQWAIAHRRDIFCADMRGAELHESFTTSMRKYLKTGTDVLPFLKHLGKVVNDWHYKELEANYGMSQNKPRLMGDVITLKHVRDLYTPKVFELFQQEYEMCLNIIINQCTEQGSLSEYKVSVHGQSREYIVTFDLSDESVACKCMKFEFMGVLCSHAIKVLDYRNIKMIPNKYILKRWTRDARV